MLSEGLKGNGTLTKLDLSSKECLVNDTEKNWWYLYWKDNDIGIEGLQLLFGVLTKNTALTSLVFEGKKKKEMKWKKLRYRNIMQEFMTENRIKVNAI